MTVADPSLNSDFSVVRKPHIELGQANGSPAAGILGVIVKIKDLQRYKDLLPKHIAIGVGIEVPCVSFTRIKMVGQEAGDSEWKTTPTATHTMAQDKYNGQATDSRPEGQRSQARGSGPLGHRETVKERTLSTHLQASD